MKMKKILAAIAACAMSAAMISMTAFASPVEGEDEDLTEEPAVEDPIDEEPVDEDPVDETPAEPDTEPEPDVAPVAEKNPGTGNSPVALAVIPVALAAAAVVAKKAK